MPERIQLLLYDTVESAVDKGNYLLQHGFQIDSKGITLVKGKNDEVHALLLLELFLDEDHDKNPIGFTLENISKLDASGKKEHIHVKEELVKQENADEENNPNEVHGTTEEAS